MELVESIPFDLDAAEIAVRLRFDPSKAGFASLDELVATARRLARPRAVFEVAYIEAREEGRVRVSGITFDSQVLSRNLEKVNKVFPFLITIGPDLEREAGAQTDLLKQYYLEEMANTVLDKASTWLTARIETRFGLGPLSSLSPGSLPDWPITEQPKLFAIFGDAARLAGVRLTESLLMIPRKSISGIFFPSEEGFVACRLCDRERCQGRRAPYGGAER